METFRYSITFRISSAILVFLLLFSSCQRESSQDVTTKSYLVEIKDDFIVNSISEYVKDQHLSNNTTMISINIKTDTYRTSLYISHTQNDLSKFERMPGQYTIVEGFLVLVFSDVDKFIDRSSVKDELAGVIRQKGMELTPIEGIDDTPAWKISKCEGHITKELETEALELPCFLKLASLNGELRIIEEPWFIELKDKDKK